MKSNTTTFLHKTLSHSLIVPIASMLLLVFFGLGMILSFAPVAIAETQYQLKAMARSLGAESGDWRSIFLPRVNLVMLPETRVAEFGIEIPKIFVSGPVIANVDPTNPRAYNQALNQGIAQAAGTNLPGNGGLGYYFAHSSNISLRASAQNAIFYLLGKLEPGDEVILWREGKKHQYSVSETKIVSADDVSFLYENKARESIVLQTCWPIGTSLKRLLVFADKVDN